MEAVQGHVETATPAERTSRAVRVQNNAGGVMWFVGWLFTIGYLKLIWWKALLALIVWPWYLGVGLR